MIEVNSGSQIKKLHKESLHLFHGTLFQLLTKLKNGGFVGYSECGEEAVWQREDITALNVSARKKVKKSFKKEKLFHDRG